MTLPIGIMKPGDMDTEDERKALSIELYGDPDYEERLAAAAFNPEALRELDPEFYANKDRAEAEVETSRRRRQAAAIRRSDRTLRRAIDGPNR